MSMLEIRCLKMLSDGRRRTIRNSENGNDVQDELA